MGIINKNKATRFYYLASGIVPSNPGGLSSDLLKVILNMTNFLLGLASSLAVLVIIWGGVKYVTSVGNPEAVSEAKRAVKYALMGLVIAALSYAIVKVMVDVILK